MMLIGVKGRIIAVTEMLGSLVSLNSNKEFIIIRGSYRIGLTSFVFVSLVYFSSASF